jgi:F-type H+-transporting ATPase subunit delta
MINNQIVRNYALALFANASGGNLEDKVFEQIAFIDKLIQDNLGIKSIMLSPVLTYEQKVKVVTLIEKFVSIEPIVKRFLLTLIKHFRMPIFSKVVVVYNQLLNKKKNIKMVQIVSARTLQVQEKEWIRNYLENDLAQKVVIEYSDDKSIIGGIIIRYDSIIRDCSILGALKKIGETMKNTRINWNIGY